MRPHLIAHIIAYYLVAPLRLSSVVEVDSLFTAFVRANGGEVVEDLVGKSPSFLNADYLFRSEGVVAELKRLVEDKSQDAAIKAKLSSLSSAWVQRRLVPPAYSRVRIESRTLPPECQREIMAVFAKPMRQQILKANSQIKSTISNLSIPAGQGLLILVNDGNFALEADAALYLIGRVLGSRCRSINSVIYLTMNMLSRTPLTPAPVLVWIHAARPGIVTPIDYGFVDALFDAWRAYLGKAVNQQIDLVRLSDRDAVSEIRLDPGRTDAWPRR